MKALKNILKLIQEQGSITIAQFMQEAMYNESEGYYINNEPIGREGDFITSPEISQLFGEMVGIFCADMWMKMGEPDSFNLVEIGPGRGTLMSDLMRATKHVKGFHSSCNIHLVETNKKLIEAQKSKLAAYEVTWHKDIYSLPSNEPIIIVTNEFFDVLPINQYVRKQDIWYENEISFKSNKEEFSFIHNPIESSMSDDLSLEYPKSIDNSIIEICYPAKDIIKHFSSVFQKTPGCLLILDYGYDYEPLKRDAYGSSLQSIKNHQFNPIFSNIGEADLTAHVDFNALKAVANSCNVTNTIGQGEFLSNLGIMFRAEILKKNANQAQCKDIDESLARLINPEQMGELFKAMAIYSKHLPSPSGFCSF